MNKVNLKQAKREKKKCQTEKKKKQEEIVTNWRITK